MKLAMVNGMRRVATKGVTAKCPMCEGPVIARCGAIRVHHWAHKKGRICDQWWEPETEWHRHWKNQFEESWQEVIVPNESTGEKHIADVKTEYGLVIEFQHSYLRSEERKSRELHYKDMVWVIDGTRLERDYQRFIQGRRFFERIDEKDLFRVGSLQAAFPRNWIDGTVACLFDFMGLDSERELQMEQMLYCILPVKDGEYGLVAGVKKTAFLKYVKNGEWSSRIKEFINKMSRQNPSLFDSESNSISTNDEPDDLYSSRHNNKKELLFCEAYKDYMRLNKKAKRWDVNR